MIKLKTLLRETQDDFKEWFRNSKIVDKNGDPLIVYHGSNMKFNRFDKKTIGSKTNTIVRGFFFTDSRKTAEKFGPNVISAYLSIKNPEIIHAGGRNIRAVLGAYEEGIAREHGQDGFIIYDVIDTLGFVMTSGNYSSEQQTNVYVVFESEQIRII